MFNVGDYLVYTRDICKVIRIEEKKYNDMDYYVLAQLSDESLTREIPTNSDKIRPLIDKNQTKKLMNRISEILVEDLLNANDKIIEGEYKKLFKTGMHEDLLKIIKASYLRNKERTDNDKKISARDETNLLLAEKQLYTEFSIVLAISYDEVKNKIINKVVS